ncbi:MAG: helix-turn-helix domain-containing protein [Rhodothermia bacterium]|nr:helix-turn-helix domain-containing protein [Rhodothermia bacterium]
MSSAITTKRDIFSRLKEIRTTKRLNQKQIAQQYGLTQQAWANYERGDRAIPTELLQQIVINENVSTQWLLMGAGEMFKGVGDDETLRATSVRGGDEMLRATSVRADGEDEVTWVGVYDVRFSAGNGELAVQDEGNMLMGRMAFLERWLRRDVGIDPERACIVRVSGDSMMPYLLDGDLVLCERVETFTADGVFAFFMDGMFYVKRVQRLGHNSYRVSSDNTQYGELDVRRAMELRVFGRVVRRICR